MIDTNQMRAIIAKAGIPRADGIVYTANALHKLANGKALFWNEECKQLEYRGPVPRKMIVDRNLERGRAELSLSGDFIHVHPADAAEMEIILRDLNFPSEQPSSFSFGTLETLDAFADAAATITETDSIEWEED